MKNIKKKILSKLLIAITVVILFFNLISPSVVQADVGGVLFWPVQQLVELLGDSLMWLMQSIFIGDNDSVTSMPENEYNIPIPIDVPDFKISPEMIFSNKVGTFDVNFFRPNKYQITTKSRVKIGSYVEFGKALKDGTIDFTGSEGPNYKKKAYEILVRIAAENSLDFSLPFSVNYVLQNNHNFVEKYDLIKNYGDFCIDITRNMDYEGEEGAADNKEAFEAVPNLIIKDENGKKIVHLVDFVKQLKNNEIILKDYYEVDESEQYKYLIVYFIANNFTNLINVDVKKFDEYTSKEIGELIQNFAIIDQGRTPAIKYIYDGQNPPQKFYDDPEGTGYTDIIKEETYESQSSAEILQRTISYWYNTLRNIAIVGMLSVLVYIGIRIVISSAASDKSKFKELLKDWFIAFCILMFMHYLMSGMVELTQNISERIIPSVGQDYYSAEVDGNTIEYNGDKYLGLTRIKMQSSEFSDKIVYTIIYAVFVIYTLIFALMYLKRVIYLAFLTMVAPLVAFTYPIDKMRDGSAQAFNMWFKEYMFNILIQPFHLVLYYIIIGATFNLIDDNPIYALVALGFLIPAERILRKFFGFDKSSESNALGGMLSGALVMQGINRLRGKAEASGRGSNGKEKDNKQIRTADSGNNTGSLMSDIAGNNEGETSSGQDDEGQQLNESEEYYNPYTDEYDKDYDPALDKNYKGRITPYDVYNQDGYGKNANGEYFNPYTDEYDKNYDPNNDVNYWKKVRNLEIAKKYKEEKAKNKNKRTNECRYTKKSKTSCSRDR